VTLDEKLKDIEKENTLSDGTILDRDVPILLAALRKCREQRDSRIEKIVEKNYEESIWDPPDWREFADKDDAELLKILERGE